MLRENKVERVNDQTMLSDLTYLRETINYLSQTKRYDIAPLSQAEGVQLAITDEMRRRWRHVLPLEAIPEDGYLRLSPDRDFCAKENVRSLQNALTEKAWPSVHYLWKQHPIMQWANDKAGQFFGRQEAPLVTLAHGISPEEMYFVIAGLIPNRRGTPLVDEWFVLRYSQGKYQETISMEELIKRTGFGSDTLPNIGAGSNMDIVPVENLMPDAIERAKEFMDRSYHAYKDFSNEQVDAELDKLAKLEKRHKEHIKVKYEQMSFIGKERRKDQEDRKIEEIFQEFVTWVTDSMEIQQESYLRVIAVFQGVKA